MVSQTSPLVCHVLYSVCAYCWEPYGAKECKYPTELASHGACGPCGKLQIEALHKILASEEYENAIQTTQPIMAS